MRRNTLAAALVAAVMAGTHPVSAQILSTTPTSAIYHFGNVCCFSYATWGQTFKAPDSQMDYFSLWVTDAVPTMNVRGHVMAFSSGKAHGSPLFSSSVLTLPEGGRVDVSTPGLTLTTGDTYVAFLTVSGLPLGVTSSGATGFRYDLSNSYSDGTLVWINDAGDPGQWSNEVTFWNAESGDMQFEMSFGSEESATPEPATLLLLASGLIGIAAARRRRGPPSRSSPRHR